MAKQQDKTEAAPPAPAPARTFTEEEVEQIVAGALRRNAQPSTDTEALARALVSGTKQVNEEAAVINQEAKSRSDRAKEVEKKIAHLDNEVVHPYLAYSTELYPHCAPTVGGQDFPKYILKRGSKFGTDVAAKKTVWLTAREAARIKAMAELKFAKIPAVDDQGNPILDKRTNTQKEVAVSYASFIRLLPTVAVNGPAIDDPAELVTALTNRVQSIEQELLEFKSGKMSSPAGAPPVGATKDTALEAKNADLRRQRTEALADEAEAQVRYGNDLPAGHRPA